MTAENVVPRRLLVLGCASSGKTTYRTQLYQRIEHQAGELQLVKSVMDMTALEGDVERLVQGLQPMHTHLDTYHCTTFSVRDRSMRTLALEFADYGGEQMLRIAHTNTVPSVWVERCRHSNSWLFFLRIDPIRAPRSFMTHPVDTHPRPESIAQSVAEEPSAQFDAIEMLQRLLFVRGATLREPLSSPRLGVLLSCWDELSAEDRASAPSVVLQRRAPLLAQFLAANWMADQLRIWGLSSTERQLPEKIPDVEFARRGPECFGYVVGEDGVSNSDLTIPVSWLMQVS